MKFSRMDPLIQDRLNPFRHGNRSDAAAFADEIDYGPMFFSLLKVFEGQIGQLATSKVATKQGCKNRAISLAFSGLRIGTLPKAARFACSIARPVRVARD